MAAHDAAHPPLRGARRRDVRQGEDRRLPAPRDRRGGDDRRRHPGDARRRLPAVDLPRARPGARPRHDARRRAWPSCSAASTAARAGAADRCTCSTGSKRFLGGYGIVGGNLPLATGVALACDYNGHRRRGRLHVRRRRVQPGHLRRVDEHRRAVEPAGGVHGDQQPVRHGHGARAPLRGDRPVGQGAGLRRARAEVRRHGRARRRTRRSPTRSRRRARSASRSSSRP